MVPSLTPTFTGAEADVALARTLWPAALTCVGRPVVTHTPVTLLRAPLDGGLAGLAQSDAGGLLSITLLEGANGYVFAHELGHAWFHGGTDALDEGRAELIAHCVSLALPDANLGVISARRRFRQLPDLATWRSFDDIGYEATGEVYDAARALFRSLERVIPRTELLDPSADSWDELLALLDRHGETATATALRGGAAAQRAALADEDADGLLTLDEARLGTDPTRRDTDLDGWWDGAPPAPDGAVALDADGGIACLPRVPPGDSFDVEHRWVSRDVVADRTLGRAEPDQFLLPYRGWAHRAGGGYVVPVPPPGVALVPNPHCAQGPLWAVVAGPALSGGELTRLDAALHALIPTFSARNLLPNHRLSAFVLDDATEVARFTPSPSGLRTTIPLRLLRHADADGTLPALAALLLAAERLAEADDLRLTVPVVVAALADSVVPAPRRYRLADAAPVMLERTQDTVAACATGWAGVLAGTCTP